MKRILTLLFAVLVLTAFSASAQQFEGLKLESYSFKNIRPSGGRSVRGNVEFVMNNSGEQRALSAVKAVVFKNGKPFVQGVCNDLTFERGRGSYVAKGKLKLARGVNVWEAIAAISNFDPSLYTLNVSLVMTHEDGTGETITRKDLPVTHFAPMKPAEAATIEEAPAESAEK